MTRLSAPTSTSRLQSRAEIRQSWRRDTADHGRPLTLEDGVLLLRVPTSVWANELSMLGDEVCE